MNKMCDNCIWKEQCLALHDDGDELTTRCCDDYTPADDSLDVEAYEADLAERHALYNEFVNEMN